MRSLRRTGPAAVLSVAALVVLLAGCGALAADEGGDGHRIVASFYPLAWVTEQVAGEDWGVRNLTTPGGEPHDLELTIDGTAALADADLVVYLRSFQPAVDDAVDTDAGGNVLDAAEVVGLRPMSDHEHSEDLGHDQGELDPHFWQDPERMGHLAEAVADELGDVDPAHAENYQRRADDLVTSLDRLDQEYADGLSGCRRDVVVVSHDAFSYLEKYGLHLAPIAGLSPGAEPTPATLAELSTLIQDEGLTTVFAETLTSRRIAETLTTDLGVRTDVLDPLEGLTDETADEDYLTIMRDNLARLEEANGC